LKNIGSAVVRHKEEGFFSMKQYTWATCSKVIQSEVNTLLTEIQRLSGQNLLGIYLHGSLALGGFMPSRSDIDVIVMTEQRLSLESKRSIVELLVRISMLPCPLDVHFLVRPDLIPFHHPLPYDLHYCETLRETYQQEMRTDAWKHWNERTQYDPDLTIYLTNLRQFGVCLYGQDAMDSLPVVPEQAFREAIIKDLQMARAHLRQDPVSFVLNVCRVSAYLHDGAILSKDAGGVWGLANLPEAYHPLLQQSLNLYRGEQPGRPAGYTILEAFASSQLQRITTAKGVSPC
jgi:streptomycin 3"-adenylyltransferase